MNLNNLQKINLDELQDNNPDTLYLKYGLDIPIDPLEIAKKLGIQFSNAYDQDHITDAGYIEIRNGIPYMWVNPAEPKNRQRFTIAHELAHYLLHMQGKDISYFRDSEHNIFKRNDLWNYQEYEANNFAASLLMPYDKIMEYAKNIINDYQEENGADSRIPKSYFIETMALIFKVSSEAMKYRLQNLELIKP